MPPMSVEKPGPFQRILTLVLNISADPDDSEYARTIKRIDWVAAVSSFFAGPAIIPSGPRTYLSTVGSFSNFLNCSWVNGVQ